MYSFRSDVAKNNTSSGRFFDVQLSNKQLLDIPLTTSTCPDVFNNFLCSPIEQLANGVDG